MGKPCCLLGEFQLPPPNHTGIPERHAATGSQIVQAAAGILRMVGNFLMPHKGAKLGAARGA